MNSDIKSLLIRVCGTISYLIVIFFFVTFILFLHNDVKDAFKEAWSVSVSFLSVLASLGAAVIAAYLFTDWRIVQRAQSKSEISKKVISSLIKLKSDADKYHFNVQFHAKAYEYQHDKDISKDYKLRCLNEAKNSQKEKDEYDSNLETNLINFFELLDLYESIFNEILLEEADREIKFKVYFFSINGLLSQVINGQNDKNIKYTSDMLKLFKLDFEQKFYTRMINALKKNITLENS